MKCILRCLAFATGLTMWAGAHAQTSKPVLIGEVAPLSGPAATVGVRLHKVTQMWVEEVNARGGINGRKIELLTCNDEARPEKAVACTRDMVDKRAALILGNSLTASLFAMQPLVRNGPILIIPSPNVVPPADSYGFQVSPTDLHLTQAIARYMKENRLKTIGMVAATDASGEVGVASAQKVFSAEGIQLRLARIDLRATDATTQLAKVAGDDVKLVYSSYTGGGAIAVVKSFKILGLPQPLMVSYGNISDAFVNVIKDVKPDRLLGTSIAAMVPDELNDPGDRARAKAFLESYAKYHSEQADMINLLGKAAVDVTEAVLRNVKDPTDAPAAKAYLESHPVPSIHTQRFSPTDHVGVKSSEVIIVELKDGRWVKAAPIR